jgi:hypothetical protein
MRRRSRMLDDNRGLFGKAQPMIALLLRSHSKVRFWFSVI